jgi:lysophospholipase L1-like esterase
VAPLRWSQRLALLAAGVLLALGLLEAGLRIGGRLYLREQGRLNRLSVTRPNDVRILCIGESTTQLGGSSSYPRQLERILDESSSAIDFAVVNAGVSATNTAAIRERLPGLLDDYEPHVVVAMMGINDNAQRLEERVGTIGALAARVRSLRVYRLYALLAEHLAAEHADQPRRRDPPRARAATPWLEQVEDSTVVAKARAAIARKDHESARMLLDKILRVDPANYAAATTRVFIESQIGSPATVRRLLDQVEAALERRLASSPDEARVRESLLRMYLVRAGARLDRVHELFARHPRARSATVPALLLQTSQALSDRGSRRMHEGRAAEAGEDLRLALAIVPEGAFEQRARIHAQIAELEQSRGAPAAAREHRLRARELGQLVDADHTGRNYRAIKRLLDERNVLLVAMQYPRRPLEPLRAMLGHPPDVVFVDNEQSFHAAAERTSYEALFVDHFAGDFGHMTAEGNRLLAENAARAILGFYGQSPAVEPPVSQAAAAR